LARVDDCGYSLPNLAKEGEPMRTFLLMVVGTGAVACADGRSVEADGIQHDVRQANRPMPPALGITFEEPPLAARPIGPISPNVPSTYDCQ